MSSMPVKDHLLPIGKTSGSRSVGGTPLHRDVPRVDMPQNEPQTESEVEVRETARGEPTPDDIPYEHQTRCKRPTGAKCFKSISDNKGVDT